MEEKIDFEAALAKEEWDINEFICYINNESPYEEFTALYDTSPTPNYIKKSKHNYHTYNLVLTAIKEGELVPVREYQNHCSSPIDYFFEPRTLLNWVQAEEKDITAKLRYYLDYSYWEEKPDWTFDDVVMLFTSKECPFPHESKINTLEDIYR